MIKTSNRYTIDIFDSMESMPIKRYRLHNLYVILDSALGDAETIKANMRTGLAKMKADPKGAKTIFLNIYSAIELAQSGINLESMAFAAIVKTINGKPQSDIKEVVRLIELSGLTIGQMREALDSFKKKVEAEFRVLLPSEIDDGVPIAVAKKIKEKTISVLDHLIQDKELDQDLIDKIDRYLLSLIKPRLCTGAKGIEAIERNRFEDACNHLEERGYNDPANMSTFRFIKALSNDKSNRSIPRRKRT